MINNILNKSFDLSFDMIDKSLEVLEKTIEYTNQDNEAFKEGTGDMVAKKLVMLPTIPLLIRNERTR